MRREGGVSSAEGRGKLTGSVGMEPKQPTLNTTREIQIVHEAIIERIERALALDEQVRYVSTSNPRWTDAQNVAGAGRTHFAT